MNPQALALTKAIKQHESGGKYDIKGGSEEYGAYQWIPSTWKAHAKEVLGDENADIKNPTNQNKVAYTIIEKDLKNGLSPAEIAAKWNSGSPKGWENKKGVNKYGVKYDVPAYVNAVGKYYTGELQKTKQLAPTPEPEKQDGFLKSLVKAPLTMLARPIQLAAEAIIPGDNTEAIDRFSKEKLGGFVAPIPKNFSDVKQDVGRGIQTAAFGLPGLASGGAAFGLGASLEQGNDLFSKETAFSTGGGAVAGKLLGFVGKPLFNAAGKVIGKITPQIVKDVASKGAGAVDDFMTRNKLLPTPVSSAINTGANKLENVVNKPFQVAGNLTRKVLPKPENIMNRVARLTPGDATKFKQMTGESHGDYLVRTGNFSNPEDIVNKEFAKFQASKAEADKAFAQIKGKFRTPEIKNALDDLIAREADIGIAGGDSAVIANLSRKYQTTGLDMTEINQLKRLIERQKLSYFKENAPTKIERATRIVDALRSWQFREAGTRGFTNLAAVNKQTQAARFIVDKLGKQLTGKSGNELIPLSDLIILSGGNIQNVIGYLAKRGFGNKTFQAKLAKILNSKEVAPFIKANIGQSEILELPAPKVFEMGGAKTPTTYEAPAKQIRRSTQPTLQLPPPSGKATGIPLKLPASARETNLGLDEVKNMVNQRGLNQPISPQITTNKINQNIPKTLPKATPKVKLSKTPPKLSKAPTTPKTAPETTITPKAIPKDLEPLAVEARKYNSWQEFKHGVEYKRNDELLSLIEKPRTDGFKGTSWEDFYKQATAPQRAIGGGDEIRLGKGGNLPSDIKASTLPETIKNFEEKLRKISPNQPESWYKYQVENQPFVKNPEKFGFKPTPLDNLAVEARKYKSAEEFVKGQTNIFRGSESMPSPNRIREGATPEYTGTAFSRQREQAQKYGDNMLSKYLPENQILKPKDITPDTLKELRKEFNKLVALDDADSVPTEKLITKVMDIAKQQNKQAADIAAFFPKMAEEAEIRILGKAADVPTKSQLTDIWNKANGKLPSKPPKLKN